METTFPPWVWIGLGLSAMAAATSILGFYAFANRKSLLSDAMSHAMLPGACLGYFFTEVTHSAWVWGGALLSALLSVWLLPVLQNQLKLKSDAATGWVLSVFFSMGIIGWNILQQQGKTGLSHVFFGEASTLDPNLALTMCLLFFIVLGTAFTCHKTWLSAGFDRAFSQTMGISTTFHQRLQSFLIVLVVVASIRITGMVLVTAWLIFPSVMVSTWKKSAGKKIVAASFISIGVAWICLGFSHQISGFSIGPWWVLCMGVLVALFFTIRSIKHKI